MSDPIERAITIRGGVREAVHNQVVLHALAATLQAAPEHLAGSRSSAEPVAAPRAFVRIHANRAMSQDWHRAGTPPGYRLQA